MISEYVLLKQQQQRATELVQAAARQAIVKQLCPPVLRQVLARMIGNSCVALGKRLLAYSDLGMQKRESYRKSQPGFNARAHGR